MSLIYQTPEDLVKDLKKKFKPYKKLILNKTSREKAFPFIKLQKNICVKLDKCVRDLQLNDNQYNQCIDTQINKILQKYYKQSDGSDERNTAEEPPLKRRKIVNSLLDLNLISDQNEDLDFEEDEQNNTKFTQILNGNDSKSEPKQTNGNNFSKMNGFHKSDVKITSEKVYNSERNGFKPELNGFPVFNQNKQSFKIPKRSSQTIESIISHSESMARSSVRPVDAFNHLVRYLTGDQWNREDVKELLLTIANYMVANKDFLANVSKFNQLIDKIKDLQYIEDDFWDQIIYSVDKKKSDSKNTHEIDLFLSSLHDFMVNNKISVRIVCTEAVIIAYRTLTNHPTAKDLIDLQL